MRVLGQGFKGAKEVATGLQRASGSLNQLIEVAGIDECVCRRDDVEGGPVFSQVSAKLCFDELIVQVPFRCLGQHAGRKIDTDQMARERLEQRPAQSSPTARVENNASYVGNYSACKPVGDQSRGAIAKLVHRLVEALGIVVE